METPPKRPQRKVFVATKRRQVDSQQAPIRGVGGRTLHFPALTDSLFILTNSLSGPPLFTAISRGSLRPRRTCAFRCRKSRSLLYANRDVAQLFGGGRACPRCMLHYSANRNQIFIDGNSDLFPLLNTFNGSQYYLHLDEISITQRRTQPGKCTIIQRSVNLLVNC